MSAQQFRDALERGDVDELLGLSSVVMPHLPQIRSRDVAEIVMHRARTGAESVSLRARAYSHAWLLERRLDSDLPDRLKPAAERLYPTIKEAVGYGFKIRFEPLRPAGKLVEKAVHLAINDVYANEGPHPNVALVKRQMTEARDDEVRRLFGTASIPAQ